MTDLSLRPITVDDLAGDRNGTRPDTLFRAGAKGAGYLVLVILAAIAVSTTIPGVPPTAT